MEQFSIVKTKDARYEITRPLKRVNMQLETIICPDAWLNVPACIV